MFTLDPLKLLLVAVVALVLLGPDKLPALARRAGSLMSDLERMRTSLREQAHQAIGDLPLGAELRDAQRAVGAFRRAVDPQSARRALYRAAGLETAEYGDSDMSQDRDLAEDAVPGGIETPAVPGSVDLRRTAPHLVLVADQLDEREVPASSRIVDDVWQPALFDSVDAL